MPKFNVSVFRVSGEARSQVEAASAGDAQERALVLSEAAVFEAPAHRRVAAIAEEIVGAQLSEHADTEPRHVQIHVVPANEVDAEGRVKGAGAE